MGIWNGDGWADFRMGRRGQPKAQALSRPGGWSLSHADAAGDCTGGGLCRVVDVDDVMIMQQ